MPAVFLILDLDIKRVVVPSIKIFSQKGPFPIAIFRVAPLTRQYDVGLEVRQGVVEPVDRQPPRVAAPFHPIHEDSAPIAFILLGLLEIYECLGIDVVGGVIVGSTTKLVVMFGVSYNPVHPTIVLPSHRFTEYVPSGLK